MGIFDKLKTEAPVPEGEVDKKPESKAEHYRIHRPRKYQSPDDFLARAQAYIESCIDGKGELNQPITITGMCCYLGTTRERLLGYERGDLESIKAVPGDDERWRDAVKRVKHICEHYAETHGFVARNPAFAIFALKNYGWKDTQTVESTSTEIHTVDPETRQLIGEYMRQLSAGQKGLLIDVTPGELPEPVKVQSGGAPVPAAMEPVDKSEDNDL